MIAIPECKYEVSRYTNSYHDNNTIGLYLSSNHDLSEDEQNIYICDTITHEYIHHILEALFKPEVTYLFDCIGDILRDDISLLRRVIHSKCVKLNCFHSQLWCDVIKERGFIGFLDCYFQLNRVNVCQILKEGC